MTAAAAAQADVIHDYNYAQVLTLDLLAKGFRLAEVPIRYRRLRRRSFVRPVPYLAHVLLAMARQVMMNARVRQYGVMSPDGFDFFDWGSGRLPAPMTLKPPNGSYERPVGSRARVAGASFGPGG
jgi:hypothetical protein